MKVSESICNRLDELQLPRLVELEEQLEIYFLNGERVLLVIDVKDKRLVWLIDKDEPVHNLRDLINLAKINAKKQT